LSPAPFLSGCAVAVPKLKRRSAGSRGASDVQTLVERADRAVGAAPGPILGDRPVAREELDRSPVVGVRGRVVDAPAGRAENWTCAAILGFNDGWRVEVVTGVD
jgi:hypothetical protein